MAMKTLSTVACTLAGIAVAGAAGAAFMVYSGVYDISASRQHTQTVYSMLETTMQHSVQRRARDVVVPPLDDSQTIARGAACYRDKCMQCHGAPGVSADDIGKGMQPIPGPLVNALQRWQVREIYYITRHGIKMSGMPAWEFRLQDSEMWDIVAFIKHMPEMTPVAYASMMQTTANSNGQVGIDWKATSGDVLESAACGQRKTSSASAATKGTASITAPLVANAGTAAINNRAGIDEVERGRQALSQYACSACHTIPGVTSSFPNVGPPLQGLASRSLIAGKLANTPQNMALWIQHPKSVKPSSAMPDMGVTDAHASDMVAYLATLR